VVFGGANFGGKSLALLLEPLRHIGNSKFGAVCFRRTYPEIKEEGALWDESVKIYAGQGGVPTESRLYWRFASGARISFRHCQREADLAKYDGSQIALLLFDQLEQFSSRQFFYLLSRNRTDCGIEAYCRATCNPDPDGWLRTFLDWWIKGDDYPKEERGYPIEERSGILRYFTRVNNEIQWADTWQELSDDRALVKSATFIHSLPEDNPIGMALNPGYIANLRALPLYLQLQREKGNWNAKPEAGKVINRAWFNLIRETDARIADCEPVLRFDFASTEKEVTAARKRNDPDFTACVLMLKLRPLKVGDHVEPSRFLVVYCRAEQVGPADVDKLLLEEVERANNWCIAHSTRALKVRWEQEPGSASVRESRRYAAMLAGYDSKGVRSVGDKLQRALPFISQAQAKNVDVLIGMWNERYLSELHNYPEVTHDDVWDANSGAFNDLAGRGVVERDPSIEALLQAPSRWTRGSGGGSRWRR